MDQQPIYYYVPIYPDDDCAEALMHLFKGLPHLDGEIASLLAELDQREQSGEGVDYVGELEARLNLKRLKVHYIKRRADRDGNVTEA
ncbi:MAG: hypothetical protein SFT94_04850 [Pseudanabaenaceae cyanobacterium bins.68]|nr:hypothetical protein [Pseudanabaenaceae cyanobacterium bins.68]